MNVSNLLQNTPTILNAMPSRTKCDLQVKFRPLRLLTCLGIITALVHTLQKAEAKTSLTSLALRCEPLKLSIPVLESFDMQSTLSLSTETDDLLFQYTSQIPNSLRPQCEYRYQELASDLSLFMNNGIMLTDIADAGCTFFDTLPRADECLEKINRVVLEATIKKLQNPQQQSFLDHNKEVFIEKGYEVSLKAANPLVIGLDPAKHKNHLNALKYVAENFLQSHVFFQQTDEEIVNFINEIHFRMTKDLQYNAEKKINPGKFRTGEVLVSLHRKVPTNDFKNLLKKGFKAKKSDLKAFDESLKFIRRGDFAGLTTKQKKLWEKLAYFPPSFKQIPSLMLELASSFKRYASNYAHPIALASLVHCRLVEIHPYSDGNGRVARLLLNAILAAGGYQPVIFPDDDAYYAAVQKNRDEPGYFAKFLIEVVIPWNEENIKPQV